MQTYPVTIEKLVYEGDGLGRLPSGEVVFVPWSAPQDQLCITLPTGKHKKREGTITSIESSSPYRVPPSCSVFGTCGGCQWQHIDIQAQREWKRHIVEESLTRIGKLSGLTVPSVLPHQDEGAWHYRNKVEWVVFPDQGQLRVGYSSLKSHIPTGFERCWIIPEAMNQLASWLNHHPETLYGIERVQVRIDSAGKMVLSLMSRQKDVLPPIDIADLTTRFPNLTGIVVRFPHGETSVWGQPDLTETVRGKTFRLSSESFFQVNREVTQVLLEHLVTLLPKSIDTLLDIYAGVGLFGIALADQARQVTLMESSEKAVENAQENIRLNALQEKVRIYSGRVEAMLPTVSDTFDVAIIDPPRQGCNPEVLAWLNQSVSDQLIYVSCNPTTLARDLKTLTEQHWTIDTIQPFDMFPQTYHIETVVSLKKTTIVSG